MSLNTEDRYDITIGETTDAEGTTFGSWVSLHHKKSGFRFIGAGRDQQEAMECAQEKYYAMYPKTK